MAEKLDPRQVVTFEELLRAMTYAPAATAFGISQTRFAGSHLASPSRPATSMLDVEGCTITALYRLGCGLQPVTCTEDL